MTPKKGRPTPSRREAEARRGIRHGAPTKAPMTAKEARAQRKAQKESLSKDERKALRKEHAAERRRLADQRRRRQLAGDDEYLLRRDKGPVRRYARDVVDARRSLLGLFMPVALVLVLLTLLPNSLRTIAMGALYVFLVLMIIDGIILGIQLNKKVRAKFPDTKDHGFRMGWYGFMRATQPRRWRSPEARTTPGDTV